MERREKMFKKIISAISVLCVVVSCTVSGYAFQYVDTKTGEIDKPVSDTVGALLEGIFTGDTIEVEDPDRREVGFEDKNGNGVYDRFFNRLMFPIFDMQGRVVGFGGRVIDKGEPKYLNSHTTLNGTITTVHTA